MQIVELYSHLNGLEFLEARRPALWKEIQRVIAGVDATACLTKESKEKTMFGKLVYSPGDMNKAMMAGFKACKPAWEPVKTQYLVCADAATNRRIVDLPIEEQRQVIEEAGSEAIPTSNQTDFVKDRVAVEVQFGKYAFVAYDLFVKHLAFYVADRIDLGVEIVPMKSLERGMSSGPSYYEKELHNLMREGRGVPAVPLVLIGVGA